MSALTDQAAAAYQQRLQDEAADEEQERTNLKNEARNELLQVIAPMTFAQSGLQIVHTNLPNRLIVVSDGTISLAIRHREGEWSVYLVEGEGENWTPVSQGVIENLADLGEILAGDA